MVGASGTVSRDSRSARRRRAAFCASVLLHAGVAWLLQRLPPDHRLNPPPVAPAAEVSISVVETPARPSEQVLVPAGRPHVPPRSSKRWTGRARDVATPETPAPVPEPTTRAAEVRAPPKVDLSFSALPNLAQQRVASAPTGEDIDPLLVPPPAPAGRPRDVDQLRADFDRRVAAIENVRAGRANPLHFDYLRTAREWLRPEATRLAEHLPLGPAESAKGWVRGYLGRVDEVNRGTARDLPESPRDDPFGPRPDVLGQYREMGRQAASGAVERTAQVCLGVAPGHPVVVTLGRSSGNAALDSLAIDAFRASAHARPVAPDVRAGLACYLVRIRAYRVPPTPSISLTWDKGPKVIYPLKRMTEVSVELESVDYGVRPPAALSR